MDLELLEVDVISYFLDSFFVFVSGIFTKLLRLGSGAYHFARSKNQCSSLRLSYSHDHSSEPTRIVLGIPTLESDLSQVKLTA